MFRKILPIFFAIFLSFTASSNAESKNLVLHLKSGQTLEFLKAETDGEFLKVTLPSGSIRLPKAVLSPQSLMLFYPDDPSVKSLPPSPPPSVQNSPAPLPPPSGASPEPVSPLSEARPAPAAPSPAPSPPPSSPDAPLEKALKRAGKNRAELEKALAQSGSAEMKRLIGSALPYDLVNIKAEHLLHTVSYYAKVKEEMPWGSRAAGKEAIEPRLWEEFVLPYRIADEDLDDWRPEFYQTLAPLVAKAKNTRDAALIAHQWLYKGNEGKAFMRFTPDSGEYRDMAPRQLLKLKEGKCFEMNMLMIALLRSIGVPARLVVIPYWMGKLDLYHSWVEYWSNGENQWNSLDAGDNPDWLMAKNQPFPVAYAYPGFPQERDLTGRERWELMENVTSHYVKPAKLTVSSPVTGLSPAHFQVYTFNYGTWRPVAGRQGNEKGEATFELAENRDVYPYLVSSAVDGNLFWDTVTVKSGQETTLSLFQQKREAIFEFPQKKEDKKKK